MNRFKIQLIYIESTYERVNFWEICKSLNSYSVYFFIVLNV